MPEDLTPEEIARLNRERYREPGRDLSATRPVEGRGAGSGGDEDNPAAATDSHGLSDPEEGKVGSDEVSRLSRNRRT